MFLGDGMAATAYNRCIFFLVDGAREDVMRKMIEAGELPSLRRYILDRGDYRKAVTSFPSTTGPAHVPFLTGCTPGTCNLPGIRWFDRSQPEGLTHFRQARSYVGPGGLYIDSDLRDGIHTIFEYFERPAGVFSLVNKGLGIFENRTLLTRNWYLYYAHLSGRWQVMD
ncbi:MAG: alkaline phosphatase family protein, partial [Gemmatimonadetes bacterium]|nr:alkaline phosphatase family protein [Gemmatimonadota bacterium]